jgi:hypothetical protein
MAGASSAYYWSDLVTKEDHLALATRLDDLEQGQQVYAQCLAMKLNQMLEQFDHMPEIWRQIEFIKSGTSSRLQNSKSIIYSQRQLVTYLKRPMQSGELINALQFNACKFGSIGTKVHDAT